MIASTFIDPSDPSDPSEPQAAAPESSRCPSTAGRPAVRLQPADEPPCPHLSCGPDRLLMSVVSGLHRLVASCQVRGSPEFGLQLACKGSSAGSPLTCG